MIFRGLLLTFFSLVVTSRLEAGCCVTPPWQQVVHQADFVGVIECVTAGGPVAGCKVEQSWKGLAEGHEFLMEWPSGAFPHLYPISLCGNRMLVMIHRKQFPEARDVGAMFWTPPAEYDVWDAWNASNEAGLKKSFGDAAKTIKEVEPLVRQFLLASESEQERELIFAVVNNYHRANTDTFQRHPLKNIKKAPEATKEHKESLSKDELSMVELQKHTDVRTLVQDMIRRAVDDQQWIMLSALEEAGGKIALEMLKEEQAKGWPPEYFQEFENALLSVSERVNAEPSKEIKNDPFIRTDDNSASLEKRVVEARQRIAFFWSDIGKSDDYQYTSDLDLLTDHDPDFISERLLTWSCPNSDWAHLLVRDFFQNCGKDREANFTKLIKAQDSFVRVMAAVYLCYENEAAGRSSLQECAKMPGLEGSWAALSLARRGDKTAFVRTFELFVPDENDKSLSSSRGRLHEALQRRLIVLLSNSAKTSGLSLPASFDNFNAEYPRYGEKAQEAFLHPGTLKTWWTEHSESIQLHDPWLDVLDRAKRD